MTWQPFGEQYKINDILQMKHFEKCFLYQIFARSTDFPIQRYDGEIKILK